MKFKSLLFILLFSISAFSQEKELYIKKFNLNKEKCTHYTKIGKLDSTLVYLNKNDSLLMLIKDSAFYYKNELLKGNYFTRKSKYDVAMHKLLKATEFFGFQQDSLNYYLGKYHLSVCYYYLNRRVEAQEKMKELLKHPKYTTDQMKSNLLSNIGAIDIEFSMIKENDSLIKNAAIYLRRAMKFNKKNNKYTYLSSNYSLLAETYNQLGNEEKFLSMIDSAVYFARKGEDTSSEGFALIKKANYYNDINNYNEGLKTIENVLKLYDKEQNLSIKIYALVVKKLLLNNKKAYKKALAVADSIYVITKKNYNKRFTEAISEMETKYKTAEKEREILIQRTDLAEKNLLIQKQHYQVYGLVGTLFIIGLLAFLFYNQQKLKHSQLIKETKLKTALHKIETQNRLQEQRLRISRDLHDNIGTQLSFIISSIDNLHYLTKKDNHPLKDKLDFISLFTTETINQLRDTIWAMNRDEISIKDLQSRILSFIENAKMTNDQVNFRFDMEVTSAISFSSIKGINLYRVVQESVNNALKYSEATEIQILIAENKGNIELHVSDNGKGFDIQTVQLGNGLINMQDRIKEVGGKINIDSILNKGTTICVSCQKSETNQV